MSSVDSAHPSHLILLLPVTYYGLSRFPLPLSAVKVMSALFANKPMVLVFRQYCSCCSDGLFHLAALMKG